MSDIKNLVKNIRKHIQKAYQDDERIGEDVDDGYDGTDGKCYPSTVERTIADAVEDDIDNFGVGGFIDDCFDDSMQEDLKKLLLKLIEDL